MGKKGKGGGERRSRRTKRSRSHPFTIYGLLTASHSKSNKQREKYEGKRTNRLNDTNEKQQIPYYEDLRNNTLDYMDK